MRDSHDPRLAVGLIGLGNMGTAFAERLLDAGYGLILMNRTPGKAAALEARGAAVARTHADLADRVDVVLTSLADDDALDDERGNTVVTEEDGRRQPDEAAADDQDGNVVVHHGGLLARTPK